jgi:HD superfamily phosphodiesterase
MSKTGIQDWLTQLKTELLDITLPLARQYWPGSTPQDEPYYNYRYQHVEQVERDALKLLKAQDGDEDIVLAAVWIHDRYKPQFEGEKHAARAAEWVKENLGKTGFPTGKIPAVVYAVANHANPPHTIPEKYEEARILWDADKLNKIGAVMVAYSLCSCGAYPQTKVDFAWIRNEMRNWLERTTNLPDDFYFSLSREIGRERWNTLKAFCDALDEETAF